MDVAARRAAQELARRRIDLVDDLEMDRRRRKDFRHRLHAGEADVVVELRSQRRQAVARERHAVVDKRLAHFDGVEEIGRRDEPVPPAAYALEREPGGLGLAQELRDARTRQPHLRGEIFTGMERAIRKLAQQRETKRSKH